MANVATTFDTLNDVGKEQRLLFLYDNDDYALTPIAYATAANLSFSADTVDVSNKMDGTWTTVMQGKKSAEVSVDALVSHKDGLFGESTLHLLCRTGNRFRFIYAYYIVSEDSDGLGTDIELDESKPMYYGQMQISSLELTSDNGDVCKYSCTGVSQGTVVSAVGMETVEGVTVQQTSIVVKQGQESTLVYDSTHKAFYLEVDGNYYNNWGGYACCTKSQVYDDDENVRTDVAFVDVPDEKIYRWDAQAGDIVAV